METPAYPDPPASAQTVSGGTVSGDEITATAGTVAIARTVTPIFVGGSAGLLVWSATLTADTAITDATFRVLSGDDRKQTVRTGTPASAVLQVNAGDAEVTLQIVVTCEIGTVMTVSERWVQTPRMDTPVVLAEPGFADASPNGVAPPPASMALSAREADSPARRSPQVRAAQLAGDLRPDLLARQSALA